MTATTNLPLRHVFSVTSGGTPTSADEHWGGGILWVTPEDLTVRNGYRLTDTRRKITPTGYAASGTTMAPVNSIVLTKRAPIGQLALLAVPACSSQGCFLLTPKTTSDSRFFYYWLSCHTEYLQALGSGSTFMELGSDDLRSVRIPHPPLQEQRIVADYLDRETAHLDSLVAQKQRILRLLAERRQALITHAVTRGLDSHASMRDSGVPWLGRFPAHWTVTRLKFAADVRTGLALGTRTRPSRSAAEYPYLSVANVQDGYLDLSGVKTVHLPKRTAESFMLRSGDVLMNEGGDDDKLGRGCVWRDEIAPCLHQNHVFVVRPWRIHSEWLSLWASSEVAKNYFQSRAKRATNLASISASNVRELPLPVPPAEEQKEIVERVTTAGAKLDRARGVVTCGLRLLDERRSALISGAVTGQIGVGEFPC